MSTAAARVEVPNDLESFWLPFTPNRAFKKAPRLVARSKDMHYYTPEGHEVLDACAAQIGALRQRTPGDLPASQLERVFALGFALDQFQNNAKDLQRCIQEWALPQRGVAKRAAA